jgi:uncharacterized membrane protein
VPAPPAAAEALLVLLRWLHALAAIVFLGYSLVVWVDGPPLDDLVLARRRYKELVELTLVVFLATGAVLSFDRLSRGAGAAYAAALALKIVCAAVAYQYAFRWRRVGLPVRALDGRIVLLAGAATVLLAAVLKGVTDGGVSSPL